MMKTNSVVKEKCPGNKNFYFSNSFDTIWEGHQVSEASIVEEKLSEGHFNSIPANREISDTVHSGQNQQVTRVVNWLELPSDIVPQITDKLVSFKDYIHFGVVCKLWHSVYLRESQRHLTRCRRQFPLLFLPTVLNQDGQTRSLYNIVEKRICNSQVQLPHTKHCVGSSHGWLVIVCENYDVYLLNPFLSAPHNEIHLPSLTTLESYYYRRITSIDFLRRVAFSNNPTLNPTSFLVMAIYSPSSFLAFWKPGDKVWTQLDWSKYNNMETALYYRDRFYFIDRQSSLFSWDLSAHPHPPLLSEILSPLETGKVDRMDVKYLVEICGDLFVIQRLRGETGSSGWLRSHITLRFAAFKIDLDELKLRHVESLGYHAVFVGLNSAFSVSALEFHGCRPNCIYFTDDYFDGYGKGKNPQDFGVFSLDDWTLEPYYPVDFKMIFPAPVWVEPTLHPPIYN